MALLFQLIRALNENEIKLISSIQMQDREREVFDMVRKVNQKTFPSLSISKQLRLQPGHLDKINSVLLKKSMELLAGKDIYSQVNYLSTKTGQWNLAKHLLKSYELKTVAHSENKEEKKQFYKFCFEWIVSAPFSHQPDHEVEYYVQSFLNEVPADEKVEQQLKIDIILLRRKLNMAISKALIHKSNPAHEIDKELKRLYRRADELGAPQLMFSAKSLGIAYHNYIHEFETSCALANELQKLLVTHKQSFTDQDKWMAQWYVAQIAFHSSRFTEALALYQQLALTAGAGNRARFFMFYAEYLQVCLITGEMKTAGEIVSNYFKNYVDDVNGTIFISAALQTAKYYLYSNKMNEAKALLELTKKNLQKTSMLQFQFAVKELMVAHAYLTGDIKKAIQLSEQNLKFMRFKNIHRTMPDFTYHSRLIKPIHKFKTTGQPLNQKEMAMLNDLQEGTRAQYGLLLLRWMHGK